MNKPFLGIILNQEKLQTMASGELGYEYLPFYEDAGTKLGIKPCYLYIMDADLKENMIKGRVFNEHTGSYRNEKIPIPPVIYNRTTLLKQIERQNLQAMKDKGILIYNSKNNLPYQETYNILKGRADINPYLKEMNSGNFGDFILEERPFSKSFFIHPNPPLVEINDIPLKLRAIVQRNEKNVWQVTGIQPNLVLVPIMDLKGKLHEDYQLDYNWLCMSAEILALQIVQELSKHIHLLADLAIDIAVREDGTPLYLKCMGNYPRRFTQTKEFSVIEKASYKNPIGFGRYLLEHLNAKN